MELVEFVSALAKGCKPKKCNVAKCQVLLFDSCKAKQDSFLDANIREDKLRPAAILVQDMIIERVIGTCFFEKLKRMVCDCSIYRKENARYRNLINDWLFPIFVWGIQAELAQMLTFQTRNNGVMQVLPDNAMAVSMNDLQTVIKKYNIRIDDYVNRAIRFLSCNDCYREDLKACECDWHRELPLSKQPINLPISLSHALTSYERHAKKVLRR